MKKLIIFSAISAAMILAVSASSAGGWGRGQGCGYNDGGARGHQGGYGHIGYLKDELKLSDDQVEKIIRIDSDYRLKFYQSRNDYEKSLTLRLEHRKALCGVLTDEQKKKFDADFRN
jgi:Spy/CpxP family protein refolding chaperone